MLPIRLLYGAYQVSSVTVRYPDNDLIEKFLSRCLAVEDLTIHGVVGEHEVWNFNISALGLKTLRIDLEIAPDLRDVYDLAMNRECNFFIDAPKLENFDYEQIFLSNCVLENAKSLVKSTIHFDEHFACECPVHATRITALLPQICNIKCLSLAAHCLQVSVLFFLTICVVKRIIFDKERRGWLTKGQENIDAAYFLQRMKGL